MRVSLKWLSDYVAPQLPVDELARRLTLATSEVEAIETVGGSWENVRVGRVLDVGPHPHADRLRLATIDAGTGPKTVVCGAPNLATGQKIAFAEVGAHLLDGHSGKPAVLKASVIRGVESAGMVCSERELGLSEEHEGILVLPEEAPLGQPLRDYMGDTILDLYSWPHRPDLMSMVGVGREVSALTGQPLLEPALDYDASGGAVEGRLSVEIEAGDLCTRYIGALIEGIIIGPSPLWMQKRISAAGMRPINNVVDITNYVMIELGQPLHAFDYDRVVDHRIIVRRAHFGESLMTLDGDRRALDEQMLVIADPSGPVALAGLMGGASSEVGPDTTRILLESANFNGINIRATSRRLRMRSEASARFEKSIGPEIAQVAARRAVRLMVELCGGRAAAGIVDCYPGAKSQPVITLAADRMRAVLGVDLQRSKVKEALVALGFGVEDGLRGEYRVSVPYWRTDVRIPDDVIEEVIRIIGYDTVPQAAISGAIPELQPEPIYELRTQVQDLLAAGGMQEIITYSLVSEDMIAATREGNAEAPRVLSIVNPASVEHAFLRPSLRPSLLSTLAANLRQRPARVELFETARIYLPREGDLPEEREMVTGVVAGRQLDRWGMPAEERVDFYDVKGIVETLLEYLRVDASFTAVERAGFVVGRAADVVAGGSVLGTVGQVDPILARRFDLREQVYLFELSLQALLPVLNIGPAYKPYPRFPSVRQDLAVIVEAGVEAGAIAAIIRQGRFVSAVRPFDVYTGPPITAGQKSIAFAVVYQAADHTLRDEEVTRSRGGTAQRLQRELGASLREE